MTEFYYNGPCKSKKPLLINDKIKLWLKRMVVGEGGKNCSEKKAAMLCWAIVHRWFLWKGARFYPTFLLMMRAFSQPINPRWMTGGDLAKKYIGRKAASKYRLERRARICAMTKFPRKINRVVEMFADGLIEFKEPQRVSNWASLESTPKKFPWGFYVDGDWFFEDKNLKQGVVEFMK